jgi:hypothetical protein
MDIIYFLRFYTAFAEDKPPAQPAAKAEVQTSQRKPSVGAFSIAHRADKLAQDASAHPQ